MQDLDRSGSHRSDRCAALVRRLTMLLFVAAAYAAGMASPAAAQAPDTAAIPGDAFLDETARDLVREARARRGMVDMRISAYETRALERMSVRLGTPLGDRLMFRRETASDIAWTRDSVHIHVRGAREVMPFARAAPQIPQDITSYMPSLAFDPVESEMLMRLESTSLGHPLAAGAERNYRYSSGDSTVITLPDGRTVRLRELRILPRRASPQLISGSFWLDAATHAVVQAYFRPAARFEESNALISASAEFDYIAIDYGLWDLQWWLPRIVAAQGVLRVAGRRLPIAYERRYTDYSVTGDPAAQVFAADSAATPLCRPRVGMVIHLQVGETPLDTMTAETAAREEARVDSVRQARRAERVERGEAQDTTRQCDRRFVVTRNDHPELLASDLLPPDIYAGEAAVVDAGELRAIAERMRSIPTPPWQLGAPRLEWPLNRPGMLRYNRVEGLSLGARATVDFARASADAGLRVGTASGEIGAEVGLGRSGTRIDSRLAAYRRLDAVDVAADPFGMRSTLSTLLLGRDDNDYFRATGAELLLRPPVVRPQWYQLRLFAERQRAVGTETDFSVARLFDSNRDMRPNVAAAGADQLGATLRLTTWRGLNPAAFRWGAELELHGEAGDYEFVRPALRLRASTPLFAGLTLGGEAAGGSAFGDPPLQRHWMLGGVGTLRGFDAGVLRGESFWHGRAELGYGLTFARLIAFTDAGWAGPRTDFSSGRALSSVGAGIGLLDGMLRFDVARARQTGTWKLHLHVNSVM
jgi:hypothetical protein